MKNEGAGDVNYGVFGKGYNNFRQQEPEIFDIILKELGEESKSILNVGAGAGSYEPVSENGRVVTAVEPSEAMRAMRVDNNSIVVNGVAENLPFPDKSFDSSMTTFSVHQWPNLEKGLNEMKRVTKGPVLILTCDPELVKSFWLYDYCPQVLDTEAKRYPPIKRICDILGDNISIIQIPINNYCKDGFNEAYYGRPEMFLNPDALVACSAWSFIDDSTRSTFLNKLSSHLKSGEWDEKYGQMYRNQSHFKGSLCLIISKPQISK